MFKTSTTIAIIILILTALLFGSCSISIEKDNLGEDITKSYSISGFNALQIKDNVRVFYSVSDSISVHAEGKDGILKKLAISVDKDSVLHVNLSGNDTSQKSTSKRWVFNDGITNIVTVYISGPAISTISISGSGDFVCNGLMSPENLSVSVTGAGDINFDKVETKDFHLSVSGAGDFDAKAITAENIDFKTTGAGDIESHIINASSVSIVVSGAGDVDTELTNCGKTSVSVSGAGDIKLKGNVQEFKQDISGAGDIDTKDLKIGK